MSKSYSHPLPVVLALSLRHYSTVTATALHAPLHTCTCATAINSTPTHCTYTPHEDAVLTCYTHIHTYIHTYIRACYTHLHAPHTHAHTRYTHIHTHMLYACFICICYMHTRTHTCTTHAHIHAPHTHTHYCSVFQVCTGMSAKDGSSLPPEGKPPLAPSFGPRV
jgi:hypothetical protein